MASTAGIGQGSGSTGAVNYRTVQQGSSINIKEQLQAKAPQDLKNDTDYYRVDLHRTPFARQRGSELSTSSVGYIHAPRRARAQTGSSCGEPTRSEETGLHHHFVETKHQQKHSQLYSADYPTVRRQPQQTWGSNESFRGRNAPKPNSSWGRPEEALAPRGYGRAKTD